MSAFVRVIPDEVRRFGAAGALVLAHIRYRCETPGPGRVEREGVRWWRVSQRDLGREVGLSVKSTRTALHGLESAVAAKHFPPLEDQSLAYRPLVEDVPATSQSPEAARPDQPVARNGEDLARNGEGPRPNGRGTAPQRASALPLETLEKKTEGASGVARNARPPIERLLANRNAACSLNLCDEAGWLLGRDGTPIEPARKCDHTRAMAHYIK